MTQPSDTVPSRLIHGIDAQAFGKIVRPASGEPAPAARPLGAPSRSAQQSVAAPSASAHAICSRIEQNFHNCGNTHLRVALVSPEDENPVRANVHDANGSVVLSFEIDRTTGIIRDATVAVKHR